MDTIFSFFEELWQHVRVADAVDVVLMSAVVYGALIWFKETASRRVLIGVVLVLILLFVARILDMYLLSLVLQAGFAGVIIILVVIFQEDLRRMFESLAGVRWFGKTKQTAPSLPIDVDALVEATFRMAHSRTGALIVLEGAEPLDRHVSGGIGLGGRLSQFLLFSLFDTSSPGHDGAVVIVNEEVRQFGAHLPISKNHGVIAGRGTRHSAALGVAECSDAMAIVVSEESGIVSVAESKRLTPMDSPSILKERIESFFKSRFPTHRSNGLSRTLFRNVWLKLLAIVLTITAWFVLAYQPTTIQRTFAVSVEFRNLASNRVLDDRAPTEVRVTLSGSERNFRFLEPGLLKVSVDLAEARLGRNDIAITDRHVKLPLNLSLYRIDPGVIRADLSAKPTDPPKSESPKPPPP